MTRFGSQCLQLLAGALAEEDVPFAQRPAGADVRILGQLKSRIGLEGLQNQTAVVQRFVVDPFQPFERCQHLVTGIEGFESHPVWVA